MPVVLVEFINVPPNSNQHILLAEPILCNFSITETDTFDDLATIAKKHFLTTSDCDIPCFLFKINGKLWPRKAKVISELQARPNKNLRRIIMKFVNNSDVWDAVSNEGISTVSTQAARQPPQEHYKIPHMKQEDSPDMDILKKLKSIFLVYTHKGRRFDESTWSLQAVYSFLHDIRLHVTREEISCMYTNEKASGFEGFCRLLDNLSTFVESDGSKPIDVLLDEYITPNAIQWDGIINQVQFRKLYQSIDMKSYLQKSNTGLEYLFKMYAQYDPIASDKSATYGISPGNFRAFLGDFSLLDEPFPYHFGTQIFLSCCSWYDLEATLSLEGFIQALYFTALSSMLGVEYMNQTVPGSLCDALMTHPMLPLKYFFQSVCAETLSNVERVRAIQHRIENRFNNQSVVCPVGDFINFANCIKIIRKHFAEIWASDDKPADYLVIFQALLHQDDDVHKTKMAEAPRSPLKSPRKRTKSPAKSDKKLTPKSISPNRTQTPTGDAASLWTSAAKHYAEILSGLLKLTSTLLEIQKGISNWNAELQAIIEQFELANAEFASARKHNESSSRDMELRWANQMFEIGYSVVSAVLHYQSTFPSVWFCDLSFLDLQRQLRLVQLLEFVRAFLDQATVKFAAVAHIQNKSADPIHTLSEQQLSELELTRAWNYYLGAQLRTLVSLLRLGINTDGTQIAAILSRSVSEIKILLKNACECMERSQISNSYHPFALKKWYLILFELGFVQLMNDHYITLVKFSSFEALAKKKEKSSFEQMKCVLRLWYEKAAAHRGSMEDLYIPVVTAWIWTHCLETSNVVTTLIESVSTGGTCTCLACGSGIRCIKTSFTGSSRWWSPKLDKSFRDAVETRNTEELFSHFFSWDHQCFHYKTFSDLVRLHDLRKPETYFVHYLRVLIVSDPMSFMKVLWSHDSRKIFHLSKFTRVPEEATIVSLLVTTIDTRAISKRAMLRQAQLQNFAIQFQELDERKYLPSASLVTMQVPDPRTKPRLVDYFVVFDTNCVARNSTSEAILLEPCLRSIWPPPCEEILAHEDLCGYSTSDIFAIRARYQLDPLPGNLTSFCFPNEQYKLLKRTSSQKYSYTLNRFVVPGSDGELKYCVVIGFQDAVRYQQLIKSTEDYQIISELKDLETREFPYLSDICLCIVSRWPFFETFERFLVHVLRLYWSPNGLPHPIQMYIANFIIAAPLPPRGKAQVQIANADEMFYLRRASPEELPLLDFSFQVLFSKLSVDTIIKIYTALLLEQHIVMSSDDITTLTPIMEAFRVLLFPFRLRAAYVPWLPASHLTKIGGKIPLFIGTTKLKLPIADDECERNIENRSPKHRNRRPIQVSNSDCEALPYSFRDDTLFVDVDSDRISSVNPNLEPLPRLLARDLHDHLSDLSKHIPAASLLRERQNIKTPVNFSLYQTRDEMMEHASASHLSVTCSEEPLAEDHTIAADEWNEEVLVAFFDFVAMLLRNYPAYVRPVSKTETELSFDKKAFLADHESSRMFCERFFETQIFEQFILDCISSKTNSQDSMTYSANFFREYIESLDDRQHFNVSSRSVDFVDDEIKILRRKRVVRTIAIPNLSESSQKFQYSCFPKLDPTIMKQFEKADSKHEVESRNSMVSVQFTQDEYDIILRHEKRSYKLNALLKSKR